MKSISKSKFPPLNITIYVLMEQHSGCEAWEQHTLLNTRTGFCKYNDVFTQTLCYATI